MFRLHQVIVFLPRKNCKLNFLVIDSFVLKQVFDTVSKATGVELSEVLKAETYAAKVDKNINAKIDTESNEKEKAEVV